MIAQTARKRLLALVVIVLTLVASLPVAFAQTEPRTFPETGHTIRGAFRVFWENNGALYNFGFPITEEYVGPNGRTTQYFERARFELNAQGGVELGKLGVEITEGRIFPKVPPIEDTPDRRYIPQTQHIIQYGFKTIWETRGAERLFGYPISEEIDEVLEDGEWHTVQYFENVRFEYWPEFAPGERVLISLLGRKLVPPDRTTPPSQPGPAPTAAPAPALPTSVNARVSPESGPPGTTFRLDAFGFEGGENVGIWLTAPDQSVFGADFQARADDNGSIAGANIGITTDASFPEGIWSFNAQGVRSQRQAIGYFRITSTAAPGDPNRLGLLIHDQLPRQGGAFVVPVAAPAGFAFVLFGGGYTPGEGISAWVTKPDGSSTAIDGSLIDLDETGFVQVLVDSAGLPDGTYTAVAQGQQSGKIGAAAFRLTRDFIAGPGTPRPGSVNGSSTPAEGPRGTIYQIRGQGLQAGEEVEYWITDPLGAYTLFPTPLRADGQGRIGYEPPINLQANDQTAPGVFGIHFRGRSSGVRVDVYFTVIGTSGRQGGKELMELHGFGW
ncbi:hypothetical protein HC891_05115 [Candidatus Gracilibacteria bacterium]|nr:hypothetical protein [Candidatus Gracilibacteria bacterium]